MPALDQSLFLLINAHPDTPIWAVDLGRFIAKHLIYLVPLSLIAIWLWGRSAQRSTALYALTATVLALGINQLIGWYLPVDRPFMIGLGTTVLAHAPTPSFPSNHYTIFLCIGITLLLRHQPRTGVAFILTGTLVAWSRIFVGVHYPSDMLGAMVIAPFSYLLVKPVWHRLGDNINGYCQRLYRRIFSVPIAAGWLPR